MSSSFVHSIALWRDNEWFPLNDDRDRFKNYKFVIFIREFEIEHDTEILNLNDTPEFPYVFAFIMNIYIREENLRKSQLIN